VAKYLITSALPYINGIKHLGNLVGSMLPADVSARYLRQRGHEVLYICATDEHGTPAELAAREQELTVPEYCRQQHELQARVYERFRLSFDHFGRSSSPENHALTQHFGRRLAENGFIEERIIEQIYSPSDARFLPDRYVIGTCPHCGYERARGDQCENCTRLLDPVQLVNPRSAISGARDLEVKKSRHLFFKQGLLATELRAWINSHEDWPVLTRSIALKWLDEGLEDRGITRDLEWGVPVDREGYAGKVYYVWFDAPIEYIAATKEWASLRPAERQWESWWKNAESVHYVQFMAKDNVPFHTIMFPAMIKATREPWKLADYIKSFHWLNYYGGKFSTSQHYGVFTDAALELLPSDYWRYFLMANAPESDDTTFTWELFASQVNKDLADTLGNFVNRVLSFSVKRFGNSVPGGAHAADAEARLGGQLVRLLEEYQGHLDSLQFRKAAQSLRTMWSAGNIYIDQRAPWRQIKEHPEQAALSLRTAMNVIFFLGIVSEPMIPDTAQTLVGVFGNAEEGLPQAWPTLEQTQALAWLSEGVRVRPPEILFRKLTDDDVAKWRERFGAERSVGSPDE
jgi:methionyl-tRNA synthetase